MKKLIVLLLQLGAVWWCGAAPGGALPGASQAAEVLQNMNRIVFIGDSITQDGNYVVDCECWLLAHGFQVEVLNLGLGSETATDLTPEENEVHLKMNGFGRPFISERLDRVLAATKPDLLFACYGMNDSTSLPADPRGLGRFSAAITRLRDATLKSGVKRVVICTPPVYDDKGDETRRSQDDKLTVYTTWLLSQRSEGWDVVDLHTPMRHALDEARVKNPKFTYSPDGTHPDRNGHWLMAREILTQFFGAQLGDASRAEDLFPANGDEIRGLVQRRMVLMFDSRMTQIGHQRPGVSGGPGAPPGLPLDQARAKAALIAEEIRSRMATTEPEVAPGGRVTFRVRAPNAREVRVQYEGGGDTGNMQKDEDGLWSFMTPPLEPDIYSYTFFVDGLRSIDLNNPLLKYNLLYTDNQVEVRGTTALPWEMQDVPHGQLHRHFYKSAATGEDRDFYVYTPPGYSPQWHRYPVLYLLHGISDDASGWTVAGRQNVILDNLIARGAAKPMVVVMPLGYGTMDMVRQGWSRISSAGRWETNLQQFRARLLDEVMPQVEASYRLSNHPQDRAIAGLSMGGAESLFVGLTEPKRFAWIGAFSSGGVGANFLELLPTLDSSANHRLGLLWISCGKNDSLYDSNQALVESLKGKGIHCTWREVPGEHSWRVWRPNLVEFAPLLFH